MKKLLVLMLVLGMASAANALVVQISAGGDPEPIDSEIWLMPSETIVLDIVCTSGHDSTAADDQFWALVVDPQYGTITGGVCCMPPAPSMSALYGPSIQTDWPGFVQLPDDGPWGCIASAPGEAAPPGIYFDEFIFHCEEVGDAIIQLWTSPDGVTMTLQDTLIIHQIPEPATMLLLGLGGLALLRRRK